MDGVGAALSFCLTPIYGHLSDRVGRRRPFILLSLFATSLPFVALSSELPIPVYLVLRYAFFSFFFSTRFLMQDNLKVTLLCLEFSRELLRLC